MIWDKIEKLGWRERVGLLLAVVFLFALFVERVVVRSVADRCRAIDREVVMQEAALLGYRGSLMEKDAIAKDYERAGSQLSRMASSDETIADFKGQIDDVARRTGLSLVAMEHRTPEMDKQKGWTEYTVVVGSFEADLKSLLAFLNELDEVPGLLRVVKLTVAPGKTKNSVKGSLQITKLMLPADG